MTDREKQIDEIYDIISEYDDCEYVSMATAIYDNGYRKTDEVTLKLDLGDRTPEEIKQIAEMFNKAMGQNQILITDNDDDGLRLSLQAEKEKEEIKKQAVKKVLKELKFLYKERAREYTNWDSNKVQAVTLEWLNADIDEIAQEYGVEIDE